MKYDSLPTPKRELLAAAQRRLPAGRKQAREAFSADHGRPVMVRIPVLAANTFYLFDDIAARALADAVVELAAHDNGGELTVTYPFRGEFRAQQHRLQLLAPKLTGIQVLAVDSPRKQSALAGRVNCHNVTGNPLAKYRIALHEGHRPILFICRNTKSTENGDGTRYLGFFTFDAETISEVAEDIDQVLHDATHPMAAFARLELLHRTTQRVSRELESYSRRVDLAIRHVRRRPGVLTHARLDKILNETVAMVRKLEEIPRRAMRSMEKSSR